MLRTGTIVETFLPSRESCLRRFNIDTVPDCYVANRSAEYPMNADEDYKRLVAERRKGKKKKERNR